MIGVDPLQLPGDAVSVWLSCAVPEIVGGLVLPGGVPLASITPVVPEAAGSDSSVPEVAITTTRTRLPTSAEPSV